MKLSAAQWPSVVGTGGAQFIALLFYGDSEAYVTERVQGVLGARTPHILLESEVVSGTISLVDRLLIPDFFESHPVYVVSQATDKVVPLLQETVEHLKAIEGPRPFLVRAGEYLGPASKLRKMFEDDSVLGSVPCYDPAGKEVEGMIQRVIERHRKQLTPEALKRLRQVGEHHFSVLPGLLDHLVAYVGQRGEIDLADVDMCRTDAESDDLREVCEAFFTRQPERFAQIVESHLGHDTSPVTMIRQLSNYTLRLFELKQSLKKGLSIEQALTVYKPPISFKERPRLIKQAREWSESQLKIVLEDLVCLEGEIKGNSFLSKEILGYRLLAQLVE